MRPSSPNRCASGKLPGFGAAAYRLLLQTEGRQDLVGGGDQDDVAGRAHRGAEDCGVRPFVASALEIWASVDSVEMRRGKDKIMIQKRLDKLNKEAGGSQAAIASL